MAEVTTPSVPTTTPPPLLPPSPGKPASKRKGPGKRTRSMIIGGLSLLAVGAGVFFLVRFLTSQRTLNTNIYAVPADYGSIVSTVQGSGMAKAKETAAITLSQGGTVQEVFVASGDTVYEGQPLYSIFSQAAQDEVEQAKEKVNNLNEDLKDLYKELGNLTVTAPFSGKLIEVSDISTGDKISSGTTVATLVNDRKLKLSLYFSYAYEDMIHTGQAVEISIPATMGTYTGKVEKINKVSFISPEGAVHFEVILVFDNPGTLTADMSASSVLSAPDGTDIYPYESGKTQYYEKRTIITETGGPVLAVNLIQHASVSAGQTLLSMGSDDIDSRIREKQKEIDTAMDSLETAQKNLANFNAVSPIDGRITTCNLNPGDEVKQGDTVIIISNTTTMLVNITVDDRNISFVRPGMFVDLSDWNGNYYSGQVTSIDTGGAESGQGMTSFPVTLTVENFDGSLIEGAWLDYSFIASQSDNCILVPMQSVMHVSDENGETYTVVFVQAEAPPENAVTLNLPPTEPGATPKYPSEESGYYPVPVTTGLSDTTSVEITSGLMGGEMVFVNFYTDSAHSY